MAKEGNKKVKTPAKRIPKKALEQHAPEPAAPEVKPSFWVYVRATLQLMWAWVRSHKLRAALTVLIAVLLIGVLALVLRPSSAPLTHDQIVLQVNKELSIQGDGNPAILTVEDKDRATQPFLQEAQNGDKVLLYYKAKKSILYRSSEKRIIHQGIYTPPDAKVFIRRGTDNQDRVPDIEKQLESVRGITFASQDVSPQRDYRGITIVSVTDRYDEKIAELERLFGTTVVRLPAGESFPEADILIIVGS